MTNKANGITPPANKTTQTPEVQQYLQMLNQLPTNAPSGMKAGGTSRAVPGTTPGKPSNPMDDIYNRTA